MLLAIAMTTMFITGISSLRIFWCLKVAELSNWLISAWPQQAPSHKTLAVAVHFIIHQSYFKECQGDLFQNSTDHIGYATGPNDVWALGVILINLATGRNPWTQASMKDETFRAYLADPDFLLSILPISKELNRILKRIFCIDPMRRIRLPELKERIRNCRYFTRTAEVDRWEQCIQKSRRSHHIRKQDAITIPANLLPPSPPATPCSDRSRSSSPTIWQQRIDHSGNEKRPDNAMPDSILTSMLTTLVV
ncbi:hypothetical protein G6F42_016047 [Rhizopus arrhizus]|nr:hypothetical protein G6F42_016047 [Rhizopus arrhizus]